MHKRNLVIILLLALIIGGLFLVSFFGSFEFTDNNSDRPDSPPTTGTQIEAPKQTIEDLAKRINSLSPVDSEPGSAWQLKRVEFVDGDNFYVEYTDGALTRRLLLRKTTPDAQEPYEMVGFFRPGEDLWKLVQGENPYFGTPVRIYEKNSAGEWEKVS